MISTYEFLATWLRARFSDSDRGAALVEYALLVALIAVACIIAINTLGQESKSSFERTGSAIGEGA
jgi:pilus assembly protein Flp/PilA